MSGALGTRKRRAPAACSVRRLERIDTSAVLQYARAGRAGRDRPQAPAARRADRCRRRTRRRARSTGACPWKSPTNRPTCVGRSKTPTVGHALRRPRSWRDQRREQRRGPRARHRVVDDRQLLDPGRAVAEVECPRAHRARWGSGCSNGGISRLRVRMKAFPGSDRLSPNTTKRCGGARERRAGEREPCEKTDPDQLLENCRHGCLLE